MGHTNAGNSSDGQGDGQGSVSGDKKPELSRPGQQLLQTVCDGMVEELTRRVLQRRQLPTRTAAQILYGLAQAEPQARAALAQADAAAHRPAGSPAAPVPARAAAPPPVLQQEEITAAELVAAALSAPELQRFVKAAPSAAALVESAPTAAAAPTVLSTAFVEPDAQPPFDSLSAAGTPQGTSAKKRRRLQPAFCGAGPVMLGCVLLLQLGGAGAVEGGAGSAGLGDAPGAVRVTASGAIAAHNVPSTVIGVELEGVGHAIYGGGLYSQLIMDESFEDPKDTPSGRPTPPTPPPTQAAAVSIWSAAAPGRSIRHCNAQLYATTGAAGNLDHVFAVVPGLDNKRRPSTVSFQSRNFPTYYIAPISGPGPHAPGGGSGRLGVVDASANSSVAFAASASYTVRAGLSNTSLATFVAADGRVVALAGQLSGTCSGAYHAPDGNVGLAAASSVPAAAATWHILPAAVPSPPPGVDAAHWRYDGVGTADFSTDTPFHGKVSLELRCPDGPPDASTASGGRCITASNKNVYRRGIAFQRGRPYEGYVFLRSLRRDGTPAALTVALAGYDEGTTAVTVLDAVVVTVATRAWAMHNFTLTPNDSDPAGALLLFTSTPGAAVGVDMVFLEPGPWGRFQGQHLRADVADGLLLGGKLRSIRLDGTSVVANPNALWHHARGPAWLRPPRYGDCWYRYLTNGFGMFEVMALAEAAALDFVAIGINVRAETPDTAADLMEYAFGNTSTPMGQLRAADGHPHPYPPTLVVELGNEEGGADYAARAVPIAAAMRQRLQRVAPRIQNEVRLALAFNDWRKEWDLAEAMVNVTQGHSEVLTWDQHDGGGMSDPPGSMANHDAMLQFLRGKGWSGKTPIYIGETNCATSRGVCVSMERALTYGLYTNAAARRGFIGTVSPAVWAYSTCNAAGDICGANDGTRSWPQAAMIITPNATIAQPAWYAHQMVGAGWGDTALVLRNSQPDCPSGLGAMDIMAIKNASSAMVAIHVVSMCATPVRVVVDMSAIGSCTTASQSAPTTVLAADAITDFNTVQQPTVVTPKMQLSSVAHGVVTLNMPPSSLAVAVAC